MSRDYEVGYGKPPEHSRFRPGHSGNPRGRPKGRRSLREMIIEEVHRPVTIREGSKTKRMPRGQVAISQLMNQAMKGNPRALGLLFAQMDRIAAEQPAAPSTGVEQLSAGARAILDRVKAEEG